MNTKHPDQAVTDATAAEKRRRLDEELEFLERMRPLGEGRRVSQELSYFPSKRALWLFTWVVGIVIVAALLLAFGPQFFWKK